MNETERYDVTEDGVNHNNASGSFVGYSDYAALEQERDRLRDALKEVRETAKCFKTGLVQVAALALHIVKICESALGGEGKKVMRNIYKIQWIVKPIKHLPGSASVFAKGDHEYVLYVNDIKTCRHVVRLHNADLKRREGKP